MQIILLTQDAQSKVESDKDDILFQQKSGTIGSTRMWHPSTTYFM